MTEDFGTWILFVICPDSVGINLCRACPELAEGILSLVLSAYYLLHHLYKLSVNTVF